MGGGVCLSVVVGPGGSHLLLGCALGPHHLLFTNTGKPSGGIDLEVRVGPFKDGGVLGLVG